MSQTKIEIFPFIKNLNFLLLKLIHFFDDPRNISTSYEESRYRSSLSTLQMENQDKEK